MSTRARIGILNKDGTVTSTYVHSDGYPEHTGKMLKKHYSTEAKAKKLMKKGSTGISFIDTTISKSEFSDHGNDMTGTDRGLVDYVRNADGSMAEYLYVFDPKKKSWSFTQTSYPSGYRPELAKWRTSMKDFTDEEWKKMYNYDEEQDARDEFTRKKYDSPSEDIEDDTIDGVGGGILGGILGVVVGIFIGKGLK
tara:strand:+ start:307 stop:891 length:585 start_codon:yes stop_codon:yes gene_type:complete